jgi:RNA polymerase sigma factor (TIGR02999 family)
VPQRRPRARDADASGRVAYTTRVPEITELLHRAHAGDADAATQLAPLVYDSLRRLASRQLRGAREPRTVDTTALVHELYASFMERQAWPAGDRRVFFAYAATAMRNLLVDAARKRMAQKRGGDAERIDIDVIAVAVDGDAENVCAIDQALDRLATFAPPLARIIELRYFAGLSVEDAATLLDRSPRSVARDWEKARLLLKSLL